MLPRWAIGIALLGLCSGTAACRNASSPQNATFALQWRAPGPSPMANAVVGDAFKHHLILFQPLNDARTDSTSIGVWQNEGGKPVRTSTNVAEWVHEHFSHMLASSGAKLVQTGETVEVRGEIVELTCVENEDFIGDVRMRFNVVVGERATWEGAYAGRAKRWGATHNPENVNEAITGALLDVARQLVSDDGFGKALAAAGK